MHTAILGALSVTFAGLLLANLVLVVHVALRMRGDPTSPGSPGWNNAFVMGWRHPHLRGAMILWTFVILATAANFCGLLGVSFA